MNHQPRDHVRFAKSPLVMAVCQVQFPVLPEYGEGKFVSPFINSLRREYPVVTREQQVGLEISPLGVRAKTPENLWRLATRENQWAVVLGESSVAIESRQYSTIEEMAERLEAVLRAAREHLGVAERTRVGLRYINEVRYPGAETLDEWRVLLLREFLGFAAYQLVDGRVERTLQEVHMRREDGMLIVRHGLLTGALVAPNPPAAPAGGQFYLIDLDSFDATPCDLDIQATMARIRGFNEVMSRLFRRVLTEKLYEYLEPTDARTH